MEGMACLVREYMVKKPYPYFRQKQWFYRALFPTRPQKLAFPFPAKNGKSLHPISQGPIGKAHPILIDDQPAWQALEGDFRGIGGNQARAWAQGQRVGGRGGRGRALAVSGKPRLAAKTTYYSGAWAWLNSSYEGARIPPPPTFYCAWCCFLSLTPMTGPIVRHIIYGNRRWLLIAVLAHSCTYLVVSTARAACSYSCYYGFPKCPKLEVSSNICGENIKGVLSLYWSITLKNYLKTCLHIVET